jgi:hypothetical protein
MLRTLPALAPAPAGVARTRARGAGAYQWQFKKSPVNAMHMGDATIARRLRRPPT